jgi:hypothetical protein
VADFLDEVRRHEAGHWASALFLTEVRRCERVDLSQICALYKTLLLLGNYDPF